MAVGIDQKPATNAGNLCSIAVDTRIPAHVEITGLAVSASVLDGKSLMGRVF